MFWMRWGLVLLFATGCTKSCSRTHSDLRPDEVVETFLDIALSMTQVSEKSYLLQLTTGSMKKAIADATDDQIKEIYINKNYEIIDYSVVEQDSKSPRRVDITFKLRYKDLGSIDVPIDNEKAATVTAENTVRVERKEKIWLISETLGKKSSIDFPLTAEDVITPD